VLQAATSAEPPVVVAVSVEDIASMAAEATVAATAKKQRWL
jgi:hypothetical protein